MRTVSFTILTASTLIANPALGQGDSRTVAAESLYQDGKALYDAGKPAEAADKFAASYRQERAWPALFGLAICHEQMGKTATAWAELREAISLAKETGRTDRVEASSIRAQALDPKLVRVQITVEDQAPGLSVTCNGSPVDPVVWGSAIPVDPGTYVFEASAPNKLAWRSPPVQAEEPGRLISVRIPMLQNIQSFWRQHRASTFTLGGAALLAGAGAGVAGWVVSHRCDRYKLRR